MFSNKTGTPYQQFTEFFSKKKNIYLSKWKQTNKTPTEISSHPSTQEQQSFLGNCKRNLKPTPFLKRQSLLETCYQKVDQQDQPWCKKKLFTVSHANPRAQPNTLDRQNLHSTNESTSTQQHAEKQTEQRNSKPTQNETVEKNYWKRLILEGFEIKKQPENLANLQSGYEINKCWTPFLGIWHRGILNHKRTRGKD